MNSREFLNLRIFQRTLIPVFVATHLTLVFLIQSLGPPTSLPISLLAPLQCALLAIGTMNILQSKFVDVKPFPLLCAHAHRQHFFIAPYHSRDKWQKYVT